MGQGMASSDNRIPVARAIEEPRDTDEELPPVSGEHDTWPPTEVPTSLTIPVTGDTIPTPAPSSTALEDVSIPPLPPLPMDALLDE